VVESNMEEQEQPPIPEHPNLKPWVKGQSGNPAGKAAGTFSMKKRLEDALRRNDDEKIKELIRVGIEQAEAGDYKFWAYIFDRIEGPITQKQDQDVTYRIVRDENP
jgi:hypothetical protein